MELTVRMLNLLPSHRFGRVAMTPNARVTLTDDDLASAILDHRRSLSDQPSDRGSTGHAVPLLAGCRILSVHRASNRTQFWIITEADGSMSIFLPEDCHPMPAEIRGASSPIRANLFGRLAFSDSLFAPHVCRGKPS
jgi:hypothetical protein